MDQFGVMHDQAYHLRQLVSRVRPAMAEAGQPTLQVCICGVRHGVGASTIAKALAAHWRHSGWNVCEEDGHKNGVVGDSSSRVTAHAPHGEPPIPRLTRRQALVKTPTPLVKGDKAQVLGGGKTLVLYDCGVADEQGRLAIDNLTRLVLVTTTVPADVLKAYALVKRSLREIQPHSLTVVINKSADRALGEEMAKRVRVACKRFLDYDIPNLFILPMFFTDKRRGVIPDAEQWCDRGIPSAGASLQTGSGGGQGNNFGEWTKTIRSIAQAVVRPLKVSDGEAAG